MLALDAIVVDARQRASADAEQVRVHRTAERSLSNAPTKNSAEPGRLSASVSQLRDVVDRADAGDDRRRRDRAARLRLVVEADVPRDERRAQAARGVRQAVDRRHHRAEMLGDRRVAEVQAVGAGRAAARRRRRRCAPLRAPRARPRAADRACRSAGCPATAERDAERRAGDRHDHAGIGIAERDRGRPAHDAVVALEDRARANRRRGAPAARRARAAIPANAVVAGRRAASGDATV